MKNHEKTLIRKIDDLEHNVTDYRTRCQQQEEEIVILRSYKLQSEMTKQLNEVKIESVQKNQMQTKDQLISATINMQQKEHDLA